MFCSVSSTDGSNTCTRLFANELYTSGVACIVDIGALAIVETVVSDDGDGDGSCGGSDEGVCAGRGGDKGVCSGVSVGSDDGDGCAGGFGRADDDEVSCAGGCDADRCGCRCCGGRVRVCASETGGACLGSGSALVCAGGARYDSDADPRDDSGSGGIGGGSGGRGSALVCAGGAMSVRDADPCDDSGGGGIGGGSSGRCGSDACVCGGRVRVCVGDDAGRCSGSGGGSGRLFFTTLSTGRIIL